MGAGHSSSAVAPGGGGGGGFKATELTYMEVLFHNLARRSPGNTMDKRTFLSFFDVPGYFGERLFAVFDKEGHGVVSYKEFLAGLSAFSRGSINDKLRMLFDIFDIDRRGQVSKEELRIMLYSMVAPPLRHQQNDVQKTTPYQPHRRPSDQVTAILIGVDDESKNQSPGDNMPPAIESAWGSFEERLTNYEHENSHMIQTMVDDAFARCDTNADGHLDFNDFAAWLQTQPDILARLEQMLVSHVWSDPRLLSSYRVDDDDDNNNNNNNNNKNSSNGEPGTVMMMTMTNNTHECVLECLGCKTKCRFCNSCGNALSVNTVSGYINCEHCQTSVDTMHCLQCGENLVVSTTLPAPTEAVVDENDKTKQKAAGKPQPFGVKTADAREHLRRKGSVLKRGRLTGKWKERYYVLRRNMLYIYMEETAPNPHVVLFLHGFFIDVPRENKYEKDGLYAFTMMPPLEGDDAYDPHAELTPENRTQKVLYVRSAADRDEWVRVLRLAAQALSIRDYYRVGKQIGQGKFSSVHIGVSYSNNKKYAIKIIEKQRLMGDARAWQALQTEISILKLVRHPCIISLEDFFESPTRIYIVMRYVSGGDLFSALIEKKYFDETIVRVITWKLLSAIRYLHNLGVVHRDLKPENILMADKLNDTSILISDFGLSQFASSTDIMDTPCGTLAYVAPEVLKMQGYTNVVDLYSIGVIVYLLFRGALPFDGKTKSAIIKRTLSSEPKFDHPRFRNTSREAIDLCQRLLLKDPRKRISVDDALAHPWFAQFKDNPPLKPSTSQEHHG